MRADTGLLSPGWAATGLDGLLDDRAWLTAMITFEIGLARAQAKLGVIPAGTAETIAAAADPDHFDWPALAAGVRETGNPVVGFVGQLTALVRAADPQAANHVHLGSTSQDVLDTATMLICRDVLTRIRDDLRHTATSLAGHAHTHRGTLMAGRTLTQHAVPITFGLKAAGWLTAVLDAIERVDRLLHDGLPVSLGGAAGTLAAYREFGPDNILDLVEAVAGELGLVAPTAPWHSTRTPIADTAAVLAFVSGALGRIAVDVAVLTRTEIGEVSEAAAPGRGASSTMPQKRNPVRATAIATAARQVPTLVAVLHQCMVVEDERSAGGWHAEWQPLREALRLVAGAAHNSAALSADLVVFPDRMRENVARTGGAIVSERLSAVLTPIVGKSEAKALLTEVTAATADRPAELPDMLTQLLRDRGVLLAWRRRHPLVVFGVLGPAFVASIVWHLDSSGPLLFLTWIALYGVPAFAEPRQAAIAGVVVLLATAGVILSVVLDAAGRAQDGLAVGVVFAAAYVATAWLLGRYHRTRQSYLTELEERAARLAREREAVARQAAAEERAWIARELHDVLAHTMSGMIVLAGGARRIADQRPETAAQALAEIERTGRRGMAETRLLLDALRGEDQLDLSPTTVKTYVSRLFTKIGARDRTHTVVLAYENGIVRPGS